MAPTAIREQHLPARQGRRGQTCTSDDECVNSCDTATNTCTCYAGCDVAAATTARGTVLSLLLLGAGLVVGRSRRRRRRVQG